MKFIKVRDVKSPVRDVNENAGIDFYIPENNEEFRRDLLAKNANLVETKFETIFTEGNYLISDTGKICIAPHKDILIPSGIKSKFASNIALIANNKSGVATKKKLIFGASVIDASYQGEWHLHIINTSDDYQVIECGTKIIQFIPHLISMDPVEIVDMSEEEFFTEKTSRGAAGFGEGTGIR